MPKPKFKLAHAVIAIGLALGFFVVAAHQVLAATQTASGSVQVTAVVHLPVPTVPATILHPVDGQHFPTTPLVVRGSCGPGLLVRVFDNGQLAGSVTCSDDGDFIANITLQVGSNRLTALNYNAEEAAGPASAPVTVYVDAVDTSGGSLSTALKALSGDDGGSTGLGKSQPLLAGTFLEPIGRAIGIDKPVTARTNWWLSITLDALFLILLIVLIYLLLRTPQKPQPTRRSR